MLRAEQRDELDPGRGRQQIDRGRAVACPSGLVRDQPHAGTHQGLEPCLSQHVQTGPHRCLDERPGVTGQVARHRRSDHGCDAPAQRRHVTRTGRMQPARQEDDKGIRRRVEPERGPGEAGVPVRPEREQITAVGGEARVEVPPEPPPIRHLRGCRNPGHPRDGERRENPHVIERPSAQQHPAETGQVTGGAEQPGMTGHPTHPPRRRVVHTTAQHDGAVAAAGPGQRRARFRRRDPRSQRRGWIEPGVPHPERPKDSVARELVEGLTGHPPDDLPEHEEVDVAVDKPLAGTRLRHLVGRAGDRRVGALEDLFQGQIWTQPGYMGQQMLDRDPVLAVTRKFGQVGRDAVAEPETPLLDENHHAGRRRHHLRQRRQIEDGVGRHRLRRPIHRARTERPLVDDLPSVPDDDHGTG